MLRSQPLLGILMAAGFLLLGSPSGHAQTWQVGPQTDSGDDGLHTKLNHGLARHVALEADEYLQVVEACRPVDCAFDPNVVGMDHSKLDHGVLGVKMQDAVSVADSRMPPLSAWAPPAEIAGKAQLAKMEPAARPPGETAKRRAALNVMAPAATTPPLAQWAPPAEIAGEAARAAVRRAPPASLRGVSGDEAALQMPVPASTTSPLSTWTPPAEIAGKAPAVVKVDRAAPPRGEAAKVETTPEMVLTESKLPPLSAWAPPAEIAHRVPGSAVMIDPAAESRGQIARAEAVGDTVLAESASPPLSISARPLKVAGDIQRAKEIFPAKVEPAWRPPAEIATLQAGNTLEAARR